MITSDAPGHIIDTMRRLSGPNPKGSKLTEMERLHLIFMIGQMNECGQTGQYMAEAVFTMRIKDALTTLGLSTDDLATVMRKHGENGAVAVVDAFAVHPNLCDPYLD